MTRAWQESEQTSETKRIEAMRIRGEATRPLELSEDVSKAVSTLRRVLARRANHFLYFPRDAYIHGAVAQVGDTIAPNGVLARLVDTSKIDIEAYVLETQVSRLEVGMPAQVRFDSAAGELYRGEVVAITPAVLASFVPVVRPNFDSNWIKVSQRVPVVVRLDPLRPSQKLPPVGSSSEVTFYPGEARSGPSNDIAPLPAAAASRGRSGPNEPRPSTVEDEVAAISRDLATAVRTKILTSFPADARCRESVAALLTQWRPK